MAGTYLTLSAYQLMWVMALFDLPVVSPEERKRATRFRNDLLDLGFEMVQFSVYTRWCSGRERAEAVARQVGAVVPPHGKVDLLFFTDKQYSQIVSYRGRGQSPMDREKPSQLALF